MFMSLRVKGIFDQKIAWKSGIVLSSILKDRSTSSGLLLQCSSRKITMEELKLFSWHELGNL